MGRHVGLMGDEDDRVAGLIQTLEERHDLDACPRIQIAGRLVGQEDRRIVDEGARDRHTLPLAAGQLVGPVALAVREFDLASAWLARAIRSLADTPAYTSGSSTLCNAVARGSRLNV